MSKKQEKKENMTYRLGSYLAEFIPKYQSIKVTRTLFDSTGKSFERVSVVDDDEKFKQMAHIEMSPLMLESILDSCPQNPDKKHRDFFDKDAKRLKVNVVSSLLLFPLYDENITCDSTILTIQTYLLNGQKFVQKVVTPLVTSERAEAFAKEVTFNSLPFGYK